MVLVVVVEESEEGTNAEGDMSRRGGCTMSAGSMIVGLLPAGEGRRRVTAEVQGEREREEVGTVSTSRGGIIDRATAIGTEIHREASTSLSCVPPAALPARWRRTLD